MGRRSTHRKIVKGAVKRRKREYTPEQWAVLPCWYATSAVETDACGAMATAFVVFHGFLCDWHTYAVTHPDELAAEYEDEMYWRDFARQVPWA